jgi:hypothetical protein
MPRPNATPSATFHSPSATSGVKITNSRTASTQRDQRREDHEQQDGEHPIDYGPVARIIQLQGGFSRL